MIVHDNNDTGIYEAEEWTEENYGTEKDNEKEEGEHNEEEKNINRHNLMTHGPCF